MNGTPLIFLIVYSVFTMNLLLQCAIGINTNLNDSNRKTIIAKLLIFFVSVILLWVFFNFLIMWVDSGIYVYILIFPAGFIIYNLLEKLIFCYVLNNDAEEKSAINPPGGLTSIALFICLNTAGNFIDAVILSFGFTAGSLLVYIMLDEIRKRSELEAVPRFLRGKPLIIISMALLSLVFTFSSLLLLKVIGG